VARFDGKPALVTGGASGFGKAIAERFASEGAKVVITDLQRELGHATARDLGVTFLAQDVTDEDAWPSVVAQAEERCGPLRILVNNAGIVGAAEASPESTTLVDWKRVFAVNVEGVFLGCRAGIRALRRGGGGSIVNISSIAGLMAWPEATAYSAGKAAVRQFTKSVAQHCAEQGLGIRCNSVHPGEVRTPLWEQSATETAALRGVPVDVIVAESTARVPLGAMPLPEDIAAAVAFLCSDDASHITGSAMIVDGGVFHCDTFQPRGDSTEVMREERNADQ